MRRLAVLAWMLCAAAPLAAQDDSTLTVAARLATEGQGDSARALVRARLGGLSPADSLYPQMLFAAGVVSGDADSATLYFRRVSIEYSRSAWADRALLRLAQMAFASGDFASARRSAERILMDYPLSEVLAHAAFWAGRSQIELGSPLEGCQLLVTAEAGAGEDVELANRARYHLQRCGTVLAAGDSTSDSTRAVAQPPGTQTVYAVQMAAVQSAAAADELMRALYADGYEPHVVRGADGLFKVRVGRHADRGSAQRLVNELRRKFGGNPFVVEEQ
ncbi:MAG: SPOR domain-containing protein [Gemmatimonadota bacterium]|nr:MAG: SPOR domain-containing protein [Gemmatimonadota bacterium]